MEAEPFSGVAMRLSVEAVAISTEPLELVNLRGSVEAGGVGEWLGGPGADSVGLAVPIPALFARPEM
jgi:hypothetical protein